MDDLYHFLTDEDFAWLTRELVGIMELTSGKIISVLEGGYHTEGGMGQGKRLPGRPVGSTRGGKHPGGGSGRGTAVSEDDEVGEGGGGGGGEEESHINLETDGGLAKGVMAHLIALMDDDASKVKMKM